MQLKNSFSDDRILPSTIDKEINSSDSLFRDLNEFLDYEELVLLEHENCENNFCSESHILSFDTFMQDSFCMITEGALQHTFTICLLLLAVLTKTILNHSQGLKKRSL